MARSQSTRIQNKIMAKKKDEFDKFAIPAGLFIGIGVGLLTGQVAGYTMIGLGFGFLVSFFGKRSKGK